MRVWLLFKMLITFRITKFNSHNRTADQKMSTAERLHTFVFSSFILVKLNSGFIKIWGAWVLHIEQWERTTEDYCVFIFPTNQVNKSFTNYIILSGKFNVNSSWRYSATWGSKLKPDILLLTYCTGANNLYRIIFSDVVLTLHFCNASLTSLCWNLKIIISNFFQHQNI